MKSLLAILDRNFARCPRCMRQSLFAAVGSCLATFAIAALGAPSWAVAALGSVALGLNALWMAHVAAFAMRAAVAPKHAIENLSAGKYPKTVEPARLSRRHFAAKLARAAGAAIALSALANSVLAAGNCDCSKCRSDQYCCPTANGYCGCFPMQCP